MSSATVSAVQTRSRRRQARRSSCAARVIVGADEDILQYLQSDDDSFFGAPEISTDSSSSEDESFLQPAAKTNLSYSQQQKYPVSLTVGATAVAHLPKLEARLRKKILFLTIAMSPMTNLQMKRRW